MDLEFCTWIKNILDSSSTLLIKWSWDFSIADPKEIVFATSRISSVILLCILEAMNGLSVASY